jgi:hypothetical protein
MEKEIQMTEVEVCARALCIVGGIDPEEWRTMVPRVEDYLAKCAAIKADAARVRGKDQGREGRWVR